MTNKIFHLPSKYYLLFAIIIVYGLIAVKEYSAKSPYLVHYVVRVSPTIQSNDLERARVELENSLFQSVNHAVAQNANLSYSDALDSILPAGQKIDDLPGGVVVVFQNEGDAAAHNLQISINLETAIEKYKIFTGEIFSVVEEDKSKGILKINVEKLAPRSELKIAILSGEYAAFLIASRTKDLQPPTQSTSLADPMQMLEIQATQTAVATYNLTNAEKLLQFQVEYDVDKIQFNVSASSNEVPSYFYDASQYTTGERNLFIETFLK
jgi:hypothetical protein